jgi:hypothetical protein
MIKSQHPRWLRTVVRLLVGLAVVWSLYDIGMNVMLWHVIQQISKAHPSLATVPVAPPGNNQAKLHGAELTAFGYSLQVPWSDTDTKKEIGSAVIWHFKSGEVVTMFRPSKANSNVDRFRRSENYQKLKQIIGAQAFRSDYDLLAAELNATPSQIHWWSSRATKARSIFLLTMKSIAILDWRAIYLQSSSGMRGFQFSNPGRSPDIIELELFDRNQRRYRIWILKKKANHTFITQTEVNALVASIKSFPKNK